MVKNVIKGSFTMIKSFSFRFRVIATYVEKMKILDYFMIAMVKNVIKDFKSFSFRGCYYVEKMKILDILWLHMVKNMIKGSFPISKVLVFEGNSYVCWNN